MEIPDNVRAYLGTDDLEISETDFGFVVRKPPYRPSKGIRGVSIGGHPLKWEIERSYGRKF